MARLFNEIMTSGEMVIDGVRYAYQFREIRKKVGNAWALIARYAINPRMITASAIAITSSAIFIVVTSLA